MFSFCRVFSIVVIWDWCHFTVWPISTRQTAKRYPYHMVTLRNTWQKKNSWVRARLWARIFCNSWFSLLAARVYVYGVGSTTVGSTSSIRLDIYMPSHIYWNIVACDVKASAHSFKRFTLRLLKLSFSLSLCTYYLGWMSCLISFERCQSSCEEHGTSKHYKKILSTVGF